MLPNAASLRLARRGSVEPAGPDKEGITAWAAGKRIAVALLSSGADASLKNRGGLTAADIAASRKNAAMFNCA